MDVIDGFAHNEEFPEDWSKENSTPLKDAFLKDSSDYLKAVQFQLESLGYALYSNPKGKPEKIAINKGGHGVGGEATLIMHKDRVNVYVKVLANKLTNSKKSHAHPQGVQMMYRVYNGDYKNRFSGGHNQYVGADLTADEFAQRIEQAYSKVKQTDHSAQTKERQQTQDYFADKFASAINEDAIAKIANSNDDEYIEVKAILDKLDRHQNGKPTQLKEKPPKPQSQKAEQRRNSQDDLADTVEQEKQEVKNSLLDGWDSDNILKNRHAITTVLDNVNNPSFLGINSLDGISKEQLKTAISNLKNWLNEPQEQQNAKRPTTVQPPSRILADTPSDSVGRDANERETTSVHSQPSGASEQRDANQSTNGDDGKRSTGVQSDGDKTGVSRGVELTGDEFGSNNSLDELRTKAIAYLRDLKSEYVNIPALQNVENDTQVEIRERGIKHIETYSADPRKLQILAKIKEILATAEYIYSADNTKTDKKPNVERYHYLKNTVQLDGKPFEFVLVIEKDQKGLLHYDILTNKYAKPHLEKQKGFDNAIPEKSQGNYQNLENTISNPKSPVKSRTENGIDTPKHQEASINLQEEVRKKYSLKMRDLNTNKFFDFFKKKSNPLVIQAKVLNTVFHLAILRKT